MDEIDSLIIQFKDDLANHDIKKIIERHIIFGTPYIFKSDEPLYFELKECIATHFQINPSQVIMVGSAKFGFSIANKKLWKKIDETSDIDMVIISDILFDNFWKDLLNFNIQLTVRTEEEQKLYFKFLEYLFKGWIRPDLFPFQYKQKSQWFEFFKEISYNKYDNRKVTCAIYRDQDFFNLYHSANLNKIKKRTEK